jgi:hypothetical protein
MKQKTMNRLLIILYTYFRAIEMAAGRAKWKIHEKLMDRVYGK